MTPWELVLLFHLDRPFFASLALVYLFGVSTGITETLITLELEKDDGSPE